MRIDSWRIVGFSGVIALLIIYLAWWGRMINDPVERSSADFMALYSAGRIAQMHGFSSIYSIKLQQEIEHDVLGFQLAEGQVLLYNHMPFLVPLLALVVNNSYVESFARWTAILSGIYLVGTIFFLRSLFAEEDQSTRFTLASSALTFLPLFISLWQGQDTAFLYIGAVFWCVGILKKRDWLAGAGLALTTIRPHISIALAVPLLFRHRRVWRCFVVLAGILAGISVLVLGIQGTIGFVNLLLISAEGDWFGMKPAAMLNLFGFVLRNMEFLGPGILSVIGWSIYLIGIVIISILWRRSNLFDERLLGLTILIAAVTAPHLHFHDLTLLIFPLLFIAKHGISALSQPRLTFIPLGASLFLIVGLLWDAIYFVLPYVLFIALVWLLWYQDRWAPSPKQ